MDIAIWKLENAIQNYAWGSRTAIAELLGRPSPAAEPEAELWLGAHPKAPSRRAADGASLADLIAAAPEAVLGGAVAQRFDGRLPFLFKVLAAARSLSIQAHPDLEQAREGFARENSEGIPLDAPCRNYRDDNHKPEIICALDDFWALCGFRPVAAVVDAFGALGIDVLEDEVRVFAQCPDREGLREFFTALMTLGADRRAAVVEAVRLAAGQRAGDDPGYRWILNLARQHPGDIGVLAPLFLNVVHLTPGQALYQPAGELHAYLQGTGIELMANSDNVLRGGCTPKHVDVPELLHVLTFATGRPDVLDPPRDGHCRTYATPAPEFLLREIRLAEGAEWTAPSPGVAIVLCLDGELRLSAEKAAAVTLRRGDSALVPAALGCYIMQGPGRAFSASVPSARDRGRMDD